uniref:Uncharacterized protein n=1 Tax=Anguilla anguilla TaxID=7936 RepID=A0A0E9WDY2_ANGAN
MCRVTLPRDSCLCRSPRSYTQHTAASPHIPSHWDSLVDRGCSSRWTIVEVHLWFQILVYLERCIWVRGDGFSQSQILGICCGPR